MRGSAEKFPLKIITKDTVKNGNEIKTIRTETLIDTPDKLINLIASKVSDPINDKKKLTEIFQETGIENTMLIVDNRTAQIFENYLVHEDSKQFDNRVWFDSVRILKPIFWQVKRGLF